MPLVCRSYAARMFTTCPAVVMSACLDSVTVSEHCSPPRARRALRPRLSNLLQLDYVGHLSQLVSQSMLRMLTAAMTCWFQRSRVCASGKVAEKL